MDAETTKIIITFITGSLLGGFIKTYFDLRKEVVSAIWEKRLNAYNKLWTISGVLPLWPRDKTLTYKQLFETCNDLKNWYFNFGGILLSRKSRKTYGKLQETLYEKTKKQTAEKITCAEYEEIQKSFHLLRNQMTKDLTSRNRQMFK
ncbi:hypothetical protein LS482_20665 [Sinomicrobium kalidii]|uniref:hypothetical protein n=1 Tax=Sinomicrobium kalidii TaxID=2900738 RepID=UPI001E5C9D49|nr:hypothetical protein [Sinomicrobium kalidii]UGU16077.1 hypothetical protein LS482_20665 [Sinomicrobium kalidii]